MKKKSHKDTVVNLVKKEPDLLKMLLEETEPQYRTGPVTPDFADKKHKTVVYLSGVNVILLKKMVQDSKKNNEFTKVTKSVILNRMMEYYLESHPNKKSRKIDEPT